MYIAAFAPDKGESVSSLIKNPPPGAPVPPILTPQDGFLFLDQAKFHFSFAADVDADTAAFMASSQVPWGVEALSGTITEPAWKTKPSWYLVSTEDRMIPPPAQRIMSKRAGSTVAEVAGSHAVYVSQPKPVAAFIERPTTQWRRSRISALRFVADVATPGAHSCHCRCDAALEFGEVHAAAHQATAGPGQAR